jgi:two-component system phosphate regulon response regulator PhoB
MTVKKHIEFASQTIQEQHVEANHDFPLSLQLFPLDAGTVHSVTARNLIVTIPSHSCRVVSIVSQRGKWYSRSVKPKILVVDDEPEAVELLEFNLKQAGDAVSAAGDGAAALKKARAQTPDMVVLDVMLPEMDGFEVCKSLRLEPATSRVPILMLTAKAAEIDRVLGLELGADDYLTKPFSPRELLLRIKKILARGVSSEKPREQMRFGDLVIDLPRHLASWKGKTIELTATEFKLLTTLAQRAGRVQSRDQLLRDVWEYDSLIDTRTVDTHMRRLREKLGPASKHLDTVRGVGYRFME